MQGKDLRIVFMGTPDFAVECLKTLVENDYNIVGVITAPDKPAGRGRKVNESAVKRYAVANNLKLLQPEKLKNPEFLTELRELKADLQIIVAFRMLPEIVWDMPRLGTFNLHASLLPQYRGAAPLNWAIINGETESGVTTFLLDHKIDTGRILLQEKVSIAENDNVGILHDKLMNIGSALVIKTVNILAEDKTDGTAQSELTENIELKHAPKIFKENCKIDWSLDVDSIHNLIRGLSPYPASWSEIKNIESGEIISLKIFASEKITGQSESAGQIIIDKNNELKVACKNGWIRITELQLSGKKRLKTEDVLRGFQQIKDYKFI
jgi:methionyl-tRNA formyltransferase